MSWNTFTNWCNNAATWVATGGNPIVHYVINFIPQDLTMYAKQQVCYFMNEEDAKAHLDLVTQRHEHHTHESQYRLFEYGRGHMVYVDLNKVPGKFEMRVEYTFPK